MAKFVLEHGSAHRHVGCAISNSRVHTLLLVPPRTPGLAARAPPLGIERLRARGLGELAARALKHLAERQRLAAGVEHLLGGIGSKLVVTPQHFLQRHHTFQSHSCEHNQRDNGAQRKGTTRSCSLKLALVLFLLQ